MSNDAASSEMGVTGNAILLLGYIAGALGRDDLYEAISAEPVVGTQIVRHRTTGNLYRIAVVQIEGVE